MSSRAWRRFALVGKAHPFAVGVGIGTVKTGAADFCTQHFIEGRSLPDLDVPRLMCFTLLGFSVIGCVQQAMYVHGLARVFSRAGPFAELPLRAKLQDTEGLRQLVLQTAFVNFVWAPVFLNFFYVFQEFIQGVSRASGPRDGTGLGSIRAQVAAGLDACRANCASALARCRRNLWEDLCVVWRIWIPGHLVTFAIPMWLRMPTTHGLSFIYFCSVSFMRGNLG